LIASNASSALSFFNVAQQQQPAASTSLVTAGLTGLATNPATGFHQTHLQPQFSIQQPQFHHSGKHQHHLNHQHHHPYLNKQTNGHSLYTVAQTNLNPYSNGVISSRNSQTINTSASNTPTNAASNTNCNINVNTNIQSQQRSSSTSSSTSSSSTSPSSLSNAPINGSSSTNLYSAKNVSQLTNNVFNPLNFGYYNPTLACTFTTSNASGGSNTANNGVKPLLGLTSFATSSANPSITNLNSNPSLTYSSNFHVFIIVPSI
jgi:hypothetical protein